jgi:hypothetical protein
VINARIVKWGIRPGECFLSSEDSYLDIEGRILANELEDLSDADAKFLFENSTLLRVETEKTTLYRRPSRFIEEDEDEDEEFSPQRAVAYRLTFKLDERARFPPLDVEENGDEIEFVVYADADELPKRPWVRA